MGPADVLAHKEAACAAVRHFSDTGAGLRHDHEQTLTRAALLILLLFRFGSIAFVAFRREHFWCETGAARGHCSGR
jgi:hypothetical protein